VTSPGKTVILQCVVVENIHTSPPPHGRLLKIPRGRGGQQLKFPRAGGA